MNPLELPKSENSQPVPGLNGQDIRTLSRLLSKAIIASHRDETPKEMNKDDLLETAQFIYKFRRRRDKVMNNLVGDGWFVDPVWDIMLDLYIHTSNGLTSSVGNACIGSAAPPTTALRYIASMETQGLVRRFANPEDRRSMLIKLTSIGVQVVEQILGQWEEKAKPARPPKVTQYPFID